MSDAMPTAALAALLPYAVDHLRRALHPADLSRALDEMDREALSLVWTVEATGAGATLQLDMVRATGPRLRVASQRMELTLCSTRAAPSANA